MGQFVVGDIVVVSFPFSNLKSQKVRPALVLAQAEFSNSILCQITSRSYSSKIAIQIGAKDFSTGGLPGVGNVRPDKVFTADPTIIRNRVGCLNKITTKQILRSVRKLFV